MSKLATITRKQFEAYEAVRLSGVTNMFDVTTVIELTGLDRPTVTNIMKTYHRLLEEYGQ